MGRQTNNKIQQLGSFVIEGWRWIDRRCRRRAAAADQWWCGRGRSNSSEDRGGAGQRVARVASWGPRERAEAVGWLGDRAGSRARRRLPGGGRGRNHSGELAARADQQARAGAIGGPKGVGSGTCWRGKAGGGGVHREASMADGGGSVLARGRTGRLYSRAQGGWGRFSCAPREPSQGVGRGMAGVWREGAAATCGVYAGARLVGRRGAGTAALRPMDARHVAPRERAGMVVPRRMDRRVGGCLSVRTRGGGGERGERARRGATQHDVVQCGALPQNHSKYPTSN
jgi:hypothetical protein